MPKVAKIRRSENGSIAKVMLTNGQILTENQAVRKANQGLIGNVHAVHPKHGEPFIRTNPNSIEKDNLDKKPNF